MIARLEQSGQACRVGHLQRHGAFAGVQNQPFTALYAILAGSVKTYTTHEDGWVRITGCHLPGEIFGFSAIAGGHYRSTARALEDTLVCELPFADLEDLCRRIPDLQSRLLHLMSQRLVEDHQLAAQFLHKRPARKRLAAFLLSLSTRAALRGESTSDLRLPMSRTDIGNYLGITLAFTWKGAVLAAAVMAFPLLVRAIRLSLEAVDQGLEAAARTLGAGPLRVFFTVTLPLSVPGIITGMVLALQSYTGFARFNAEGAVANVVVLSITRELGPVLAGLMVAGRIGAAFAAEIGILLAQTEPSATTGAVITSHASSVSHTAFPVRRSSAARRWTRFLPGYAARTIFPQIAVWAIKGSPSHRSQRARPVDASTTYTVQLSVLNATTPSATVAAVGPSSRVRWVQRGSPVAASNA